MYDMTRQCLGKNRYGNIRIKKTYLYVSGNIPYEQVVLGKRGVELNIEIKKKESEPPYENIPHEQVVLGEQGVEISKLKKKNLNIHGTMYHMSRQLWEKNRCGKKY